MGKKQEKAEKERIKRLEAFDNYYSAIYKDRYIKLKEALLKDNEAVSFSQNLISEYFLDRASILVAQLLPLKEGDNVLDMCAAPGGKTLVMLSKMNGNIYLTANDRSRDRKQRLDEVIRSHIPEQWQERIKTTCYDASTWGLHEKEVYDAILLDAPCSSERHVIKSEKHLAMWSPSRPKRLAIEQYALLASAFDAVKKGGYILYSTCSINPEEDEKVIEKLIKRKESLFDIINFDLEFSEERAYGRIILPDSANNLGPLYACLIRKKDE
ncbi:RsmB/NOP family class I SAM-dependent RNA methyltransferase [Bullifex porci]|uniref:NOL1/NOP2/Sun domain family member 4 n=1 Tax=Bullifex porci TaxID=2606638 RepID=A0A7X2TQW1_9SPIO|nr:RsmB/NOP family class I SAM-dependent RNA methyltransferase [Bullifex porci]MDD7255800.1 RsmB/NOP family class I SAM-dependent RNA methyltransferase [Bullifex porci]MDD7588158.1 RsmB/NOP family class I SAM-dependent RNA methyltransferase [Bullifex porci]MDY2741969.1 RsmB/NOP family class I SAM-dependent RNA methyltransferase [Bullifex porci]MSU06921.1 RsmB/NOP family class I SAM-dependent RNA methyltransferase [Bullifex porci]